MNIVHITPTWFDYVDLVMDTEVAKVIEVGTTGKRLEGTFHVADDNIGYLHVVRGVNTPSFSMAKVEGDYGSIVIENFWDDGEAEPTFVPLVDVGRYTMTVMALRVDPGVNRTRQSLWVPGT